MSQFNNKKYNRIEIPMLNKRAQDLGSDQVRLKFQITKHNLKDTVIPTLIRDVKDQLNLQQVTLLKFNSELMLLLERVENLLVILGSQNLLKR